MRRELTGRDVAAITVGAFAVIVGVNLLLAWSAVATFPGIEVRNGYVASQSFEAERLAQERLGWRVETSFAAGRLTVGFAGPDGRPAEVTDVAGLFGRATSAAEDVTLAFSDLGAGRFAAPVAAGRGAWVLHLKAVAADGTPFRQRVSVWVAE